VVLLLLLRLRVDLLLLLLLRLRVDLLLLLRLRADLRDSSLRELMMVETWA